MIKNLTLFLFGIVISVSQINAQGGISCPDSEQTALCDLDDINGTVFTNPPPGGNVPSDALCDGGAFHNPGWFSFVAGSEEITLTVTPVPGTCDTVANGNFGVQVALWEGCPDLGGECVAGDANCSDQPVTLEATDLTVGDIYNLVIDGCSGSVCTVEVTIDNADAFQLPPLDGVDFADPDYFFSRGGGCENSLGDGNFCADKQIIFQVEDDFYETLGAEWYWSIAGTDPATVEWEFGLFSGTGNPIEIGDLNGDLGANGLIITVETPGMYTICLENVITECDADAEGPLCVEINIITPGDQEFGEWDVCSLDLLAGWDPADEDAEDINGNPWIAGPITLDMVEANDGLIEIETEDDCGCAFTQIIQVNARGSVDREEVELFIWECMLPYEWYEEEFPDLESLPEGGDFLLRGGSAESDYNGERCDSLVTLTITPLTMLDTVIVGDCTPQGTEFTFVFTALDPNGDEIEVEVPSYEWIDAATMMPVGNTQTVLLETGSYYVNFESFIDDLNYLDNELAGLEELHSCDFLFGPYDLVGGSSTSPDIEPYDAVYCPDELNLLTFTIDTLPNTDYNWIVPPSYNILFTAEDSLAVSIDNYVPTDTLFVTAANSCGSSDSIPLPISVNEEPLVSIDGPPTVCDGQEYFSGYNGDPAFISMYQWDVPGGTITTGTANSQMIGITYSSPGNYSYTLTVTDLEGCTASAEFDLIVEELLENPEVLCDGDPSQIVFTWDDVPGATSYDVTEVSLPPGATGMFMGNTTYVVTGINGGDIATIQVTSVGATTCVDIAEDVSCEAPGCNFSGIVNNNFNDFSFCRGDTNNMLIQFDITLPPGFTGTYSGNGVTPDGLFDPDSPQLVFGANNLNFDYVDASGCSGTIPATVTVFQLPNATFTPTMTRFCVGEVIVLSGAASQGMYDYGPGAMGDLNGLSYSSPGVKTIEVTVIDPNSGCRDDFALNVTVIDTVPAPLISCVPGTSSIDFDWDDHPLADLYELTVVVNGGTPEVITQSNSDYTRASLMEDDVVELTVSVTATNGCNTAVSTESCEAKACIVPDIVLTAPQEEFCTNDNLNPVFITPTVDGFTPADGTFTFIGNGVTLETGGATFDPSAVNPGMTRVTFRYTNPADNCVTSDIIDFTIIDVPQPDYSLDQPTLCVDELMTINLETLPANVTTRDISTGGTDNVISPEEVEVSYDFPGTYEVLVSYTVGNCPAETVPMMVTVNDTIQTPRVNCVDVDTDFIQFGWQDQGAVSEYEVYIDNQLVSTQSESEFLLSDLDAEQQVNIRVVAIDPICGNKEGVNMCATQSCIPPTWSVDVDPDLCFEAGSGSVQLDVSALSNSMTPGTLEFLNPEVDDNGVFTPADVSQSYTIMAQYTEKNCVFDTSFDIRVNIIPVAQLQLLSSDVICEGSSITVASDYVASNNEMPIWDFGGGTESGTGFGPYDVSFDTPGSYTLSLEVDNNGCIGAQETVTVTVEEELLPPDVTCSSTDINEISISWDAVDCAAEYRVLVNGNEEVIQSTTDYTITGLQENEEVDIVVEAISECACSNVLSQTFTCSTKECIAPTWDINVDPEFCYEPGSGTISLNVTATSNEPSGTGVLSWPDASVDDNGNFTPGPNSQDYTLTVIYTEGECVFENTVSFRVNIEPEAQLELIGNNIICEGEFVTVASNYLAANNETANWDFGGGSESGSGFGPYDVSFDTPGNYTISLFVDNNNCPGDQETVDVEVQAELVAPVVDCSSDDINSIDLSWDAVDCAAEYRIIVDGQTDGTTPNTNYTISGLDENQEVDVVIEAISECACDNVLSQTVACSSKPCDPTTWSFSGNTFNDICLDVTAQAFTISATPDDLVGNGTGSWTGLPISDPSGVVDPSLVGAGTYDLVYTYEEGGCSYQAPAVQITFVEAPELSLTAEDPACPDDMTGTIMAAGSGGVPAYSYALDGGAFQSGNMFTDVSIGSHTVEVQDANGCVNSASISIFAPSTPVVEISGPSTVIVDNDAEFSLDIQGIDNIDAIIWYQDSIEVCNDLSCLDFTVFQASSDFNLVVEVIYNGGCRVFSEFFNVDVKEIQAYYIPNIVSYNNDPANSNWNIFIKGNETFPRSIKVYTRWGNLIHDNTFAPSDLQEGQLLLWDGFSNDNPVETGVYVYALEIEIEGRTEFIVGDVTILR